MATALVSFDRILEGVADETGITNLDPFHEKIRRLIFRCEQDIGVGGSVILKRAVFSRDKKTMQKYLKYPDDFVEFEAIGNCSGPFKGCDHQVLSDGIRLCHRTLPNEAVMYYWGLYCDGSGNPVTTESRYDAVVSYIVWKLYSPQVFLNRQRTSANLRNMYKDEYESNCLAARGNDAMPTIIGFNELSRIQDTERMYLVDTPYSFDFCNECINDVVSDNDDDILEDVAFIWFWQENSPSISISDVILKITEDSYVTTKQKDYLDSFLDGKFVNYEKTGRIAFAAKADEDFRLFDIMNNDITDNFERHFLEAPDGDFFVYISQDFHVYSSVYFKFIPNMAKDITNLISYWQFNLPSMTVTDASSVFTPAFYTNISSDTFEAFNEGKTIVFESVGRIVFALSSENPNQLYRLYDIMNNDITETFDEFYDAPKNIRFYVTKEFQVAPTLNIKIKKQ